MNESKEIAFLDQEKTVNASKEIWKVETGILDLPETWNDLAVPELVSVRGAWATARERLETLNQLDRFSDQLKREWAIETGIIENLYEIERGVTKTLIEQGFQAALLETGTTNKPRDWVITVLKDQQEALEGLFAFVKQERPLSTSYIKELHSVLLRNQKTVDAVDPHGHDMKIPLLRGDWKKSPNYPTMGGVTFRYCPPEQVASEMDRLIAMHNDHIERGVPSEIEAAWLHHRFSQIHPFQDGNGRVARTLASLVFIQNGLFPLVVTRDEKVTYLEALEAGDAGDLEPLTGLFAKLQRIRYRMAISVSETVRRDGVSQALEGIKNSVAERRNSKQALMERVFGFAQKIAVLAEVRLSEIEPVLGEALHELEPASRVLSIIRTGRQNTISVARSSRSPESWDILQIQLLIVAGYA